MKFEKLYESILNEKKLNANESPLGYEWDHKSIMSGGGKYVEWGLVDKENNLFEPTFKEFTETFKDLPFLTSLQNEYDVTKKSGALYEIYQSLQRTLPFNKQVDLNRDSDIKNEPNYLERLKVLNKKYKVKIPNKIRIY